MTNYLIRLDDACPTMCYAKWDRIESLLDKYEVKPMVGVIPHNEDSKQQIDPEDGNFWQKVKVWKEKGWVIAMHGYNHVYTSKEGGINPLWKKSEFAGHPLELQRHKIKKGVSIMRENGINPQYFFAPSHTFDENTLVALREETDIRIISDTIASRPYKQGEFVFIPQQAGHPINIPFGGIVTICYHPNSMDDVAFNRLGAFLQRSNNRVLSFDQLVLDDLEPKGMLDKILSSLYFAKRKFR